MTEVERPQVPGWVERMPRWQHRLYLVLAGACIVAGALNALIAGSTGQRLAHLGALVVFTFVFFTLLGFYARRRPWT